MKVTTYIKIPAQLRRAIAVADAGPASPNRIINMFKEQRTGVPQRRGCRKTINRGVSGPR